MKNKFIEIKVNINPQGVCEITLNRPDKHNAMSRKMIDELEEVGQHLKSRDSIRVVFLKANGKTFCLLCLQVKIRKLTRDQLSSLVRFKTTSLN